MLQWEYAILTFDLDEWDWGDIEDALNNDGLLGWEAVSMVLEEQGGDYRAVFLVKRMKMEQ